MLSFAAAASMTAMLAGSPDPSAQRAADLPTVTISVHTAPAISPVVVDKTLEEASAIWRPTGVTFKWQKIDAESVSAAAQPTRPRVIITEQPGRPSTGGAPIGWVTFVDDEPDGDIHVSHANAERYILSFGGLPGGTRRLTPAERFLLMGRTLGRALAHEIGHYLLRSKAHTTSGLMKANRTVKEFTDADARGFEVDTTEREAVVRRVRQITES
jgi:hypothetical protein